MAHIFKGTVKDINGNTHLMELYRPDYEFTDEEYIIKYSAPDTPTITHRGNDKDQWDDAVIQGIEYTYRFFIPNKDIELIDEILESAYGTFYFRHSIIRQGVPVSVNFIGILKPENIVCDFRTDPPYVEIIVAVTDGMTDLQQINFNTPEKTLVTGRKKLLEVLQLAVQSRSKIHQGGLFYVVLNTLETNLMVNGDCALDKLYVNCERFFERTEKGDPDVMSCYDVIEAVLRPFNCKMIAMGSVYYITNYHEYWSKYHWRFAYYVSTLNLSFADQVSEVQDVTTRLFRTLMERQVIQPIYQVDILFKNRNIGGDLTGVDLMSLSSYDHDFYTASITSEGFIQFVSNHTSKHEDYLTLSSDFDIASLVEYNSPEFIRIQMLYQITGLVATGIPAMKIELWIKRPVNGGTWYYVHDMPLYGYNAENPGNSTVISYDSAQYVSLKVYETGLYNLKFVFKPYNYQNWDWTVLTVQIKGISITRPTYGEEAIYEPSEVNIDQDFVQYGTNGIEKIEKELILADGGQITEVGALMSSTNEITKQWTRHEMYESIKLVDAYARNLLTNRSRYKNFLRLTIIDRDHTLDPRHILSIIKNDVIRYYAFSSYSKNFRLGEIECELVEIVMENEV